MPMTDLPSIAIRAARREDEAVLVRLAALDAATPFPRPALVATLDGVPAAAVSLVDGRAVADPFLPSAEAVALLRHRAAAVATPARRRHRKAPRLRPRTAI